MLKRIEHLHDAGFFEGFRWPSGDVNFESITVVYGPNGSGKSTISRELLAAAASDRDHPHPLRMAVGDQLGPPRVVGTEDELLARLYVFSEVFVRENHRLSDIEATVPAIVTLGKRTIENEEKLSALRAEAEEQRREVAAHQAALESSEKALTSHLQSVSGSIVNALFRYGAPYQSRSSFNKNSVAKHYGASTPRQLLDSRQYSEAIQLATGPAPKEVHFSIGGVGTLPSAWLTEAAETLAESPTTLILDTLRTVPNAEPWVRSGRPLHLHTDTCIFCGGTLSTDRRRDIDAHFSEGVNRVRARALQLLTDVDTRIADAEACVAAVRSACSPLAGSRRLEVEQEISTLRSDVGAFLAWAHGVRTRLASKAENVTGIVDRDGIDVMPRIDLERIRRLVDSHNEEVRQHEDYRRRAAESIRDHHLKEGERGYVSAVKQSRERSELLEAAERKLSAIERSVAAIAQGANDIAPSAAFLTEEVGRILGRRELSFHTVGSDRYEIRRHGQPAHSLSEGERTAITLVHFVETVRRHDHTGLGLPIVVVDDPVSSLDQGVFIGVSSALWSLAARREPIVEQLVLLTHNFELFRQWDVQWDRFPRDLKSKKGKPGLAYSAFELTSEMRGGRRIPRLASWPRSEKHRKKSRSAYHHAFVALADAREELSKDDELDARLEAQLLFPNVIRRVLETFLAFKFPHAVGDLAGMMAQSASALEHSAYGGDAASLRHDLLRFSNVYSHGETPQTDYLIGPEEVHSAIGALFTFMHIVDPDHFNGMCEATGFSARSLLEIESV